MVFATTSISNFNMWPCAFSPKRSQNIHFRLVLFNFFLHVICPRDLPWWLWRMWLWGISTSCQSPWPHSTTCRPLLGWRLTLEIDRRLIFLTVTFSRATTANLGGRWHEGRNWRAQDENVCFGSFWVKTHMVTYWNLNRSCRKHHRYFK